MVKETGHIKGCAGATGPSFFVRPLSVLTKKRQPVEYSPAPVYTNVDDSKRLFAGAFTSITARLPGYKGRFENAIAPMLAARNVGEMKQFFRTLPDIIKLAKIKPRDAHAVLSHTANSPNELYVKLTAIACGDIGTMEQALNTLKYLKGNHALVLDCIRRITPYQPEAAHLLLKQLFENDNLDTPTRLALFRELMMSKEFNKDALPKSFEQLMKDSTPVDRNRLIYPSVLELLEKWKPHDDKLKINREITKDMMRGWIASCEVITDGNHRRAQEVLLISPSARG